MDISGTISASMKAPGGKGDHCDMVEIRPGIVAYLVDLSKPGDCCGEDSEYLVLANYNNSRVTQRRIGPAKGGLDCSRDHRSVFAVTDEGRQLWILSNHKLFLAEIPETLVGDQIPPCLHQ